MENTNFTKIQNTLQKMKPSDRISGKKNGYQSDEDNVRYKINTNYFNNVGRSPPKVSKKQETGQNDDDDVRYKFPTVLSRPKPTVQKPKPKQKIKVNFWSTKRTQDTDTNKNKSHRRHTIAAVESKEIKPKNSVVKVRKRVSFLPSPLFSENHVPMVTVPDDLTIQLNEEEANDLREDLNQAFVNSDISNQSNPKRKARSLMTETSPKNSKRKRSLEESVRSHGSENELEFFSKYVVQKLRKMETNQRIYSENLINTVLMLGQLGKLNGKSKIAEA